MTPNVPRAEDYAPTSLRNPQPLMESLGYLEAWEMMDPATSFTSPRLGYWIILQHTDDTKNTGDPILLINAARSALAPKCPQYVHGRGSPPEPNEFVEQTITLGPFLDKREAKDAARTLKRKKLATGQTEEEPVTRILHRPASPEQWKPL